MKFLFYPFDVRTEEGRRKWLQKRLGVITASAAHRVLQPKKLELSEQRRGYLCELLEEWMTGEEIERYANEWQQRGLEEEDAAIAAYEAIRGETQPGGFFTTDDGLIGASPDRLVGEDGDLEIKCGALRTVIGYALDHAEISADHQLQIQTRLWLHGRDWCDVFAYHPALMLDPVRVRRNEKVIAAIEKHLPAFAQEMLRAREKLEREHGPFERRGTLDQPPWRVDDIITEADLDQIIRLRQEQGL